MASRRLNPRTRAVLLLGVVLALFVFALWLTARRPDLVPTAMQGLSEPSSARKSSDAATFDRLFAEQAHGAAVEVSGRVLRLLEDDARTPRHQRFIVGIGPKRTLLIAHNIDISKRVPVAVGDSVQVRGEYEWNPEGGVVHWTHVDPQGQLPGGWIRHAGVTYR